MMFVIEFYLYFVISYLLILYLFIYIIAFGRILFVILSLCPFNILKGHNDKITKKILPNAIQHRSFISSTHLASGLSLFLSHKSFEKPHSQIYHTKVLGELRSYKTQIPDNVIVLLTGLVDAIKCSDLFVVKFFFLQTYAHFWCYQSQVRGGVLWCWTGYFARKLIPFQLTRNFSYTPWTQYP
jgi:hypothetical protein